MFNRRFIRIKVFQVLYAYFSGTYNSLEETDKDLKLLFDRIYDLYHFIMLLLIELADYFKQKYDLQQKKYIKDPNDISNKHIHFYNNAVIELLRKNPFLHSYTSHRNYSWRQNEELLKDLYNLIVELPEYQKYVNNTSNNFEDDKEFVLYLIETVFYNNEVFVLSVEEESIFWADNTDFALLSVALTIEKFSDNEKAPNRLMPKFKNKDDESYATKLLHKSILKSDYYSEIIKQNVINWDYERISLIDKIILMMAISELLEFEEIPIKVSLNEYIELAKQYGIPNKSFAFVNGLLDKITEWLKNENLIMKTGRGLLEK